MGYTHYFRSNLNNQTDRLPAEQLRWDIAYAEAEKIARASRSRLEEEECESAYDAILVRGDCETLIIPRLVGNLRDFDFCKTRRYDYDAVVTAVLAVMAETGIITVSSDGFRRDWDEGVELASKILGREVPNPIEDN